jgi:hypothetical protein
MGLKLNYHVNWHLFSTLAKTFHKAYLIQTESQQLNVPYLLLKTQSKMKF